MKLLLIVASGAPAFVALTLWGVLQAFSNGTPMP